jgi:3-oxoacyl-(acyl-carrier-protein) synthase/acyl carrier protein
MEHISSQVALTDRKEVAIIGIAGLFPGSSDLESLFEQLKSGTDWVRKLTENRLTDARCNPGKNYRPLGYLDAVDKFDHSFFGISKSEAEAIDPVQRLLLELVYTAFEDGGIGPENFQTEKISLYIGGLGSNYQALSEMDTAVSVIGNTNGIIAGRIAYALDLRGSAIMLDTTCSSALTAIHEAYRHIVNGDMKMAVAGSVNVQLFFAETDEFSPLNTMSEDGRCKPFDAKANGIGSGEGGGVIIMKNLSDAIADGDQIYAVIKGGATNNDGGLSNGLTAPSPEAQKNVILEAWRDAAVAPDTIGYVEAHGTGTRLGDPIEFQALTEAFKFHNVPDKSCALGAVKSNFGHLDHAAGMAGIFKILSGFKFGKLFPTLHFEQPNPFLDYANSALYVNTEYKEWESANGPKRAGISSFGLSGTNVHLVLEEYQNKPEPSVIHPRENALWLKVSAKTPQALNEYCKKIMVAMERADEADLPNLLQTLNSSRGDYEYRFSATAENRASLIQKLKHTEAGLFRKKALSGVTVLLSDGTLPEAYMDLFGELDPEIKRIRATVLETYEESWAKTIADQLSFLMFLDFLGLKMTRIVAGGLGRISQRVYNDLSLISKIRQFIDEGVHLAEIDKTKLEHALSVISATEKNPVFIAVNNVCPLVRMVRQINATLEIGSVSAAALKDLNLNQFFEFCFRQGLVLELKKYGLKMGYKVQAAPTYPFQKIRCWFDAGASPEISDQPLLKEKLFVSEFTEDYSDLAFRAPEDKVFMAFTEDKPFSEQVIRELRKLNQVIVVQPGSRFRKVSADHYEINKDNANEFLDLFNEVKESQRPLSGILLDWGYQTKNEGIGFGDQGLYSNYHIAKAFRSVFQARNFGVYVVTRGLFDADFHYPNTEASNHGFWKGILSDHPWLDMRLIDFASANQQDKDALSFLQEIGTDFPIKVARYEDKTRLISLVKPYESEFPVVPAAKPIKKENYLITGGLGRIGRGLCESLAPKAESLVILGSSDYRSDPEKVKVMDLLRQSTAVEYHQVDIADSEQMEQLLAIISGKYKQLHTIYHLAGKTDDFVSLEEKTLQGFERTIAPKVAGTILLKRFAEKMKPEFFILFSSLNSILPKKNSFDYAAANAFEDHLAFKIPMQGPTKYISINWPGWDVFQDELSNDSAIRLKDGILIVESIKLAGRANVIVSNPADLQVFRINPFFAVQSDGISNEEVQEEKAPAEVLVAESQLEASLESVIMQIWKDVLKSDDIDPEDDFFDIGGHSLNGTQVLNRIYKHFAVDIDMDDFFDYGTLKSQCDLVRSRIESLNNAALPVHPSNTSILPLPAQEDYATSDIQRTFWMNSQLQQDSRIYNLVFPFFIKGTLHRSALEKTMLFLLNRHEALRTGFRLKDGEIRQFIIPVSSCEFNIRYEEASTEMSWDAYAQQEHDTFFDLTEGLLIKACTVSFRGDYHLFVLTLHHLNADGWSHGVLLREFILAYKAYSVGTEPDLSPLKFQYKDYVVWLQNLLATQEEEDSAYWNDKLYGQWPMLEIPEVVEEAAGKWGAGTLKITIPLEETLRIKAFAKQQDVTLFMLLVTISKVLLHQSFGWNDVVIGTVTSGRIHPDLENQIGNYLNTLALRDAVYADMPFSGLLSGVRQTVLEAFKHQSYPFTKIVEQRLKDGADWQERWLDVQVNLHNYQRVEDYLKDETSLFEVPEETTNYDHDTDWNLHFNCLELEKDVLSIYINYSKQVFTEESIQSLKSNFLSLLKLIIINPALHVGELTAELRSTVTLKQTKKQLL